MASIEEVLRTALSLTVEERAALAEQLLASLDELSPEEADRVWAEEAQRRLDSLRAGTSQSVSAAEVHAKAEKLLGG